MKLFPVVLQARMGSTRLPGKVLRDLCGKPLLSYAIASLLSAQCVSEVILAVDEGSYAALLPLAARFGCRIVAGSEENVLSRFIKALDGVTAEHCIRATGDNPLVCPELLDRVVAHHLNTGADVSHFLGNALGTGVEVVRISALREAALSTEEKYDLEHVTPYLYRNSHQYHIEEPVLDMGKDLRLTVDTEEDFCRVERIFRELYSGKPLPLSEILRALNNNPGLFY